MPTSRPELAYRLCRVSSTDALQKATLCLAYYLHHTSFDASSRGIIYVLSRSDAEKLARVLGCLYYHAQMNPADRSTTQDRWSKGTTPSDRWIVATSAFSHGIDQPYVNAIIFAGRFHDLIKFAQAAARGGRKDSKRCEVVTFFTSQAVSVQNPDNSLAKEFNQWFLNTTDCRRLALSTALDGPDHSVTCQTLPNAELCDICSQDDSSSLIGKAIQYAQDGSTQIHQIAEVPNPFGSTRHSQPSSQSIYDRYLDNEPITSDVLKELAEIEKEHQERMKQQRKRSAPEDSPMPPSKRQQIDQVRHQSQSSSSSRHQLPSQHASSRRSSQRSHQPPPGSSHSSPSSSFQFQPLSSKKSQSGSNNSAANPSYSQAEQENSQRPSSRQPRASSSSGSMHNQLVAGTPKTPSQWSSSQGGSVSQNEAGEAEIPERRQWNPFAQENIDRQLKAFRQNARGKSLLKLI